MIQRRPQKDNPWLHVPFRPTVHPTVHRARADGQRMDGDGQDGRLLDGLDTWYLGLFPGYLLMFPSLVFIRHAIPRRIADEHRREHKTDRHKDKGPSSAI